MAVSDCTIVTAHDRDTSPLSRIGVDDELGATVPAGSTAAFMSGPQGF